MSVLKVNDISKSYGELEAVQKLSFEVPEGLIFGLLGPNGAGKTSTIRMIMGIILPDSGSIEIFGRSNSEESRNQIGYMPEERGLYKKMKLIDAITFFAELKKVPHKIAVQRANSLLEQLELIEWRDKKVQELSKGMQQKLQFLITILHQPKLLILDEPFTGLDPVNTNLIKDMLLELKKNGTAIIFSTHLMDQVEKLCDRICLINKGQNVLYGTLSEVKKKYGHNRLLLRYEGNARFLGDAKLVKNYNDYGNYVEIEAADGITPQDILKVAIQQVTIFKFEIAEPSLNEIFIDIVKKAN